MDPKVIYERVKKAPNTNAVPSGRTDGRNGTVWGCSGDATGRLGDATRRSRTATGRSGDATDDPGTPIWDSKIRLNLFQRRFRGESVFLFFKINYEPEK